jgi:5-formyltetrahydrofolate cyclo-ligase
MNNHNIGFDCEREPALTKAELRATYLERRRALSPETAAAWSAEAVARLRGLAEMADASAYLLYLSSVGNELDTLRLAEELLREGRTVLVPVSRRDRTLLWSRIEALSEVAPTRFGILEPKAEFLRPTEPPAGSVAVVPGIAFTRQGARIGFGAGYYDRFLAGFAGAKLGLAYEMQIVEAIPVEPHDVFMDAVVTEAGVYGR